MRQAFSKFYLKQECNSSHGVPCISVFPHFISTNRVCLCASILVPVCGLPYGERCSALPLLWGLAAAAVSTAGIQMPNLNPARPVMCIHSLTAYITHTADVHRYGLYGIHSAPDHSCWIRISMSALLWWRRRLLLLLLSLRLGQRRHSHIVSIYSKVVYVLYTR